MLSLFIIVAVMLAVAVALGAMLRSPIAGVVGAFVSGLIVTFLLSITVISSGHVGIQRTFGVVSQNVLPEGFYMLSPLSSIYEVSVRRQAVDFDDRQGADAGKVGALSLDQNPVTVTVSMPYALSPTMAWKVYQRIGSLENVEKSVLVPAAQAATRDVIARMPWVESSISKRGAAEEAIQSEFQRAVANDLQKLGFSEVEARSAFTFMPVLLRDVRPDQRVLTSIAEKVAAEQDLQRQQILTQIAKEEAERRSNEGVGVSRLFAQLPQGFSAQQISAVLYALADKQRADALMKAVESGKVSTMVLPSTTPAAVGITSPATTAE